MKNETFSSWLLAELHKLYNELKIANEGMKGINNSKANGNFFLRNDLSLFASDGHQLPSLTGVTS